MATTSAPSPDHLKTAANAIRFLAIDAVAKAKSGHQGMPMGMADIATILWAKHLRHNPSNPHWANRDRFVVSNGHGSMLPYALLHLSGYDLSMADLEAFRQLHSKTPGHPEVGITPGIETTTGPLGQGIANAVGMALAEQQLGLTFNREDAKVVDHYTYCFLGDGCMMEGVSHEACSFAGVLGLNKLIAFYDDNGISIDGEVKGWLRDDPRKRFESYGWNVIGPIDGHDMNAVDVAINTAKMATERPTLIVCKTHIGFGSPNKVDTSEAHGTAIMGDEIAATRANLDWNYPPFEIPADAYAALDAKKSGVAAEADWNEAYSALQTSNVELAAEFARRVSGDLPSNFADVVKAAISKALAADKETATRKAAQNALEYFGPALPEMFGGSADLTGSNLTNHKQSVAPTPHTVGNHVHYGVREFAMCAMANGIALHGGFLPYVGTFLVFSDYARNAVRMAALMKQRVLYIFTHDSIGVGEDGPTHQPVEHVASLRLIPNLNVWRPADAVESAVAYAAGIERRDGPSMLCLSRQNTMLLKHDSDASVTEAKIRKGGYVLIENADAKITFIATGSEIGLALSAAEALGQTGIKARVVSMPCCNIFDKQDAAYKKTVLGTAPRLAIEAGIMDSWWKYVGLDGDVVGMTTFGESAPAGELMKLFGLTTENVVAKARALI